MIDTFFYGLFMDRNALLEKGFQPGPARKASVRGFALRIGARATLVPAPDQTVWGAVMALSAGDIKRLYGEPSVADYCPEAVLAIMDSGETSAALCYNLPEFADTGVNIEYAAALYALARKFGLPDEYLDVLRQIKEGG